jgi:hypothetical protein
MGSQSVGLCVLCCFGFGVYNYPEENGNTRTSTAEYNPPPICPTPITTLWDDPSHELIPVDLFASLSEQDDAPLLRRHTTDSPQFMKVFLTGILGQTRNNTIYNMRVDGSRDLAVKYNGHCVGDDDQAGEFLDPLALETHFLKRVNEGAPEVAIKHYFTSEAVPLPPRGSSRSLYGKLGKRPPTCPLGAAPTHVRLMIMEKIAGTLYRFISNKKRIDLNHAVSMGIQMVRLLRDLHALGIIHGDIHPGNIGVAHRNPPRLIVIDFGAARRPRADIKKGISTRIWCNGYISMWESIYWPPSYRDDMFRMVQMLAIMMHGMEYYDALCAVCNHHSNRADTEHYYDLKSRLNFFNTVIHVPFSDKSHITKEYYLANRPRRDITVQLFDQLLQVVRSPASPTDKPDYDRIENILTHIRNAPSGTDPAHIDIRV